MSAPSSTLQFYRCKPRHSYEKGVRLPTRGSDAGQAATVRADDVVSIVDRLKELIKYKGYSQEVPMAFVVRQPGEPGQALDEARVIDFVAGKVAPFKKVRQVETPCPNPRPARSCAGC